MRLKRPVSEALDGILGDQIPVLDKGFVSVVDYMGTDWSVVDAARESTGGGSKTQDEDARLIRRLMRKRHTSPFEAAEIRFKVRLPIFVARQWIRHRTANVNEYSGRYAEMAGEFYLPEIERLAKQSATSMQGSGEGYDGSSAHVILHQIDDVMRQSVATYEYLVDTEEPGCGMAREQARIVLPLSSYTSMSWKIDLHNLLHFLELRSAPDAQQEIREYAEVIAGIVKQWVPVTYAAWLSYRKNAVTLSKEALEALIDVFEENGVFKNEMETALEDRSVGKSEIRDVLAKLGL